MSIEEKEGRHARSVRLTTSINTRLITLCDHLGVTPNSYLVQAIGKAITHDEINFKIGQTNDSVLKMVSNLHGDFSDAIKQAEEKQLPLDKDL